VIVCFVDIDGIVEYHCLNFLFHNYDWFDKDIYRLRT